jgi:deoxyribodipyrimidine photo-lyase
MILWHFPYVVQRSFKPAFDRLPWMNGEDAFSKWKAGMTGYPMVDAGMRQLTQTGYMHNRLRMITASFLTKHLMVDWRWGEAWFAEKLFDYELSSNNGGWQWSAGTGCDAAPYFRVFNPTAQQKKFDPDRVFIRKWIPEADSPDYPPPLVDHKAARERWLKTVKELVPSQR